MRGRFSSSNGVDDGNNASYVDMSAAQAYSNSRSPPNHADDVGRWTDEELSLIQC